MTTTRTPDEVIHEYPAVAKYRIRVLTRGTRSNGAVTSVDVREYVSSEKFEGFTRRGIRISDRAELQALHETLGDVLTRGWVA